jgi:hypothetical protein
MYTGTEQRITRVNFGRVAFFAERGKTLPFRPDVSRKQIQDDLRVTGDILGKCGVTDAGFSPASITAIEGDILQPELARASFLFDAKFVSAAQILLKTDKLEQSLPQMMMLGVLAGRYVASPGDGILTPLRLPDMGLRLSVEEPETRGKMLMGWARAETRQDEIGFLQIPDGNAMAKALFSLSGQLYPMDSEAQAKLIAEALCLGIKENRVAAGGLFTVLSSGEVEDSKHIQVDFPGGTEVSNGGAWIGTLSNNVARQMIALGHNFNQ